MNRLWRALLALTLVCALSVFAAACGGDDEAAPAETTAPAAGETASGKIDPAKVKTKTWRIAVDNPHYLFQVDALWAKDKGYLSEYGIDDIELTVTDNPIQAMIGGSVDMILYDTDSIIGAAAKTKQDMKVVGMYIEQEANILGARKGIDTPEQLKGSNAKIAVSGRGSRSYIKMVQMLEEAGIDTEKDVQLLDTGGQSNERLQQIINGTVDLGSIQLRHETILTEAGGKFLIKKVYDSPQLAWATTGEILAEDPEGVAAFLAATLKARQDIIDGETNKDAVLALMEENKFELPQSFKDAYAIENAPAYRGRDGGWNAEHMDPFIEEAVTLEQVPAGTDWREFVDVSALWRAQDELGLERRPTADEVGAG